MDTTTQAVSTQAYQAILYERAVHPGLFDLRSRQQCRTSAGVMETWLLPGGHLLRFEIGGRCAAELMIDREGGIPDEGVVSAFLCAGEHEFEHSLPDLGLQYMLSVQTEQLSENLYAGTLREMREHAAEMGSDVFTRSTPAGTDLSVLDVQSFHREVHVQAYHLVAQGGFVLRSQSLFEHK
ncbi:MAG: hypothetical protein AAFR96_02330 [Planctomycetota bacterium]